MGRAPSSPLVKPASNSSSSKKFNRKSIKINNRLKINELLEHPLLSRCKEGEITKPPGTLVWAKETGSVYWPACISINPEPEEGEEVVDEEEKESSKFALVIYFESKYRIGLINWNRIIPVVVEEAKAQRDLIMELNRLDTRKLTGSLLQARQKAYSLMEPFLNVPMAERVARIEEKFREMREAEKEKRKSVRASRNSLPPQKAPQDEVKEDKVKLEVKKRSSSAYTFREKVNEPKKWNEPTALRESSERSSSDSSGPVSKKIKGRSNLEGEELKQWVLDKFESMDKQMRFESLDYVCCSKCSLELRVKEEMTFCHDYPFHITCTSKTESIDKDGKEVVEYKCEDCLNKNCFICKKTGDELPHKCSKCDLRFHRDCLIFKWPQADVVGSTGKITCPLHFCHICKTEHFHFDKVRNFKLLNSKAIKCIYCLSAYHKSSCIPAGTGNTIMLNQFLICPRHTTEASLNNRKSKKFGCFTCQKKLSLKDPTVSCTLCPLMFHASCVHGEDHIKAGIPFEEFRDTFKCEGCLWGTFPLYGQVVWYQQPGSSYWPSQILYPKGAAARGATQPGQFSIYYCGAQQFYDNGRSFQAVPLEIGNKDFLKRLNLYDNHKVANAAKEAFHLIKFSESYRDSLLPKPEPIYTKIDKNVYRIQPSSVSKCGSSGRRGSSKNKIKEDRDDIETCSCGESKEGELVCTPGSGCYNRIVAIECNEENCSGKERCANRMFSTKNTQAEQFLEYFVSSSTKGWGLRSLSKFSEGTFLIEYTGEIISKEEVMWRVERKCDDDPLYFLEIDTSTFIDAEYYGNLSRLINHSCDPNCRIEKYTSASGKPVVGIFANRDIEEGEELTFDYNFGPKSTFTFNCRCKSEICKGYIGRNMGNEENLIPNGKRAPTKGDSRSDWKWEDECATCGTRGELLMCDFIDCSKAYHLQCLGIGSTPRGEWNCPCHVDEEVEGMKPPRVKKAKLTKSRQNQKIRAQEDHEN